MTMLRPRPSFSALLALIALQFLFGANPLQAQSVPAAATQPPQQSAVPPSQAGAQQQMDAKPTDAKPASAPNVLSGLRYRSIGPFRGGRVTTVAGVSSQPYVYYFGATGGGVWKTTDGGVNWEPVSDGFFKTGSVGAIGVAESDPNLIYVGMGESPIRGNVSHGDGMYKSSDAGKTWKKIGLENTRHIARVRVHPKNPDLVYVAALGHTFGANKERGVYRSRDGGKNWELILTRGDKAGAIDLTFDPTNANTMYAGFWQVLRTPYSLESGGAGGGLFKSTDGGDTWTELTRNAGLPKGLVGKVGVTVSPVNPERVWTIIEAEDGGVFRSDDAGKTWTRTSDNRNLRQRAWYYNRIYADTASADTVYVLNVGFHKSTDGGRTFTQVSTPHSDNHDLWIAPNDAARMVEGNDGGANVTFNAGKTWTEQDQATAQFYRVTTDNDFPYGIYGAQQDNSTIKIKSRTDDFAITANDWHDVGGGESGWIAPHPRDSEIVFAGSYGGLITRYDHRTRQQREVNVYPDNPMGYGAEGMKYRFQWNFPILFSPHDASENGTLYTGGNILFRSTDQGQSWQAISPDLTRDDKAKQGSSGGAITKDNTSVEYYSTIFTVAESPIEKGVIWTGSDDGLVHVTRDGGANWQKIQPQGIPDFIQINSIEASPHDAGTAYVAATMYKSDDFRPYLYKTSNYGKSWTKITAGIPNDAFTRVIREDPNRRGLLYAGTETGMYVSFDDGTSWRPLQLNLPVVPITDLAVHKRDRDLVVATQGRSFYVLDDLTVLHAMRDDIARTDAHLFKPEDTYRTGGGGGFVLPATATVGANPPGGVVVHYFLKNKVDDKAGEATLEFLDASGKSIKRFTSKPPAPTGAPGGTGATGSGGGGGFAGTGEPRLPSDAGLNRFVWDMRHADATTFPGLIMWAGSIRGPRIVPGAYTARLTVAGKTLSENFEVKADPRVSTPASDYAKQLDMLLKVRDKLTETHKAIIAIRDIRKQIEGTTERTKGSPAASQIADAAKSLATKLTAIEEELYQTKLQSSQDPLNFPIKLNNKLAALGGVIASADAAPTTQSYQVYDDLTRRIDAQLGSYKQLVETDIPNFNRLVRERDVPAVIVR